MANKTLAQRVEEIQRYRGATDNERCFVDFVDKLRDVTASKLGLSRDAVTLSRPDVLDTGRRPIGFYIAHDGKKYTSNITARVHEYNATIEFDIEPIAEPGLLFTQHQHWTIDVGHGPRKIGIAETGKAPAPDIAAGHVAQALDAAIIDKASG